MSNVRTPTVSAASINRAESRSVNAFSVALGSVLVLGEFLYLFYYGTILFRISWVIFTYGVIALRAPLSPASVFSTIATIFLLLYALCPASVPLSIDVPVGSNQHASLLVRFASCDCWEPHLLFETAAKDPVTWANARQQCSYLRPPTPHRLSNACLLSEH